MSNIVDHGVDAVSDVDAKAIKPGRIRIIVRTGSCNELEIMRLLTPGLLQRELGGYALAEARASATRDWEVRPLANARA